MKKIVSITTLALLIMTACTNEIDLPTPDPQPGGKQVTITAKMPEPGSMQAQTRVSLDDQLQGTTGGEVLVTWKADDTFVVVDIDNPETTETFTLATGAGTSNGTFTGTMPEGEILYAYSPSLNTDFTTQVQTAHASLDHLGPYHYMEGEVNESEGAYTINFYPFTALMKFDLTLPAALAQDEVLQSLTLSANQSDWLFHSFSPNELILGSSLTLGLNGVTPTNENKIIAYMMLAPYGSLDAGKILTITLTTNQQQHTFEATLPAEMLYEYGQAYTATIDASEWTTAPVIGMKFKVKPIDGQSEFTLPFETPAAAGTYDLTINWGDEANTTSTYTGGSTLPSHTYTGQGPYLITISTPIPVSTAQMPRWRLYGAASAPMLVSMDTPMLNTGNASNYRSFYGCTNLTTIVPGLFDNHTAATDFSQCFNGCGALTEIPARLFANCTAAINFSGCFANCTQAKLNPDIFGDDLSARFAGQTIDFSNCFQNVGSALNPDQGGEAPALWNIGSQGNFVRYGCFNNCTNITNYADILGNWK